MGFAQNILLLLRLTTTLLYGFTLKALDGQTPGLPLLPGYCEWWSYTHRVLALCQEEFHLLTYLARSIAAELNPRPHRDY